MQIVLCACRCRSGRNSIYWIFKKYLWPCCTLFWKKYRKISKTKYSPIVGLEGLDYRLGGCCSPLPGESILGTVALGNHGITIHRTNCVNIQSVPSNRRLLVKWNSNTHIKEEKFPIQLRIEVIDRVGVLKDILMRLSDRSILSLIHIWRCRRRG